LLKLVLQTMQLGFRHCRHMQRVGQGSREAVAAEIEKALLQRGQPVLWLQCGSGDAIPIKTAWPNRSCHTHLLAYALHQAVADGVALAALLAIQAGCTAVLLVNTDGGGTCTG
jgi:hypothetical protein